MTHWRALLADGQSEKAFSGRERIVLNPNFFRRLDGKVAAIARAGLVPALVQLWTLTEFDPGDYLPEEDAIRLARYIVARYEAFRPVWLLGGDGRYHQEGKTERWRRIGRGVFGGRRDRNTVTVHPCGHCWTGEMYRMEEWFDFIGYQSGHGPDERSLAWILFGEPATHWKREPYKPVVNLEPCYETHAVRGTEPTPRRLSTRDVRRAMYASLLVSPTAGVTYGEHSIWPWNEYWEEPLAHRGTGIVGPWSEGLVTEGARAVTHMVSFFSSLPWWTLRPAPQLVVEQPGSRQEPSKVITAAQTTDGRYTVIYLPYGGEVKLLLDERSGAVARWFDPRNGIWVDAGASEPGTRTYHAPSDEDWLLRIGPNRLGGLR